ncbi:MAG TPA: hypothetical protein VEW69_02495 [Alphaproteobacteria bacterium]|nr:hypothetical protein [Alphaproteobacteria bacterium]
MHRIFAVIFLSSITALSQTQPDAPSVPAQQESKPANTMTVPAGTQVLLHLQSPIDTASAKAGDGVYCRTAFPVTVENVIVIPAGTYVKGQVAQVQRAGKVKGRAEVLLHFNTMIFPNGYTVDLPGALESEPGARKQKVADQEGTVQADSQKGKDTATVAKGGAGGAVLGRVVSGSGKGAAIGGGAGALAGLGAVLFTRGQDVRIEQGAALEMVLERPLVVEVSPPTRGENGVVPRSTNKGMRVPQPPSVR